MNCPNFFIIGAPKCGTSSLAWWLNQHPQVWFSKVKEPHFFNDDSDFRQVRSRSAYEELFEGAGPDHLQYRNACSLGRMCPRLLRTGKGIMRRLRQLNRREVARKPLPPEFEAELRAAFAEDIALLQQVTGRDLSHWQGPQQQG